MGTAAAVALAACVPQPPAGTAAGGTSSASSTSSAPVATSSAPAPATSSAPAPTTSTRAPAPGTSAPTATETLAPPPASDFVAPAPEPVLAALTGSAPVPTAAGLTQRLAALLSDPGLGGRVGYDITDVETGENLLARGAQTPVTPASTTKLLTAVAALSVLGPQERLATRVVPGADDATIVLVGGGDMLLATGRGDPTKVVGHAGLADLADGTAEALEAAGRTRVVLRLDDTLFSGPRVSPAWSPADLTAGFVAPVAPLAVESGRASSGDPAIASDPALAAATAFATLLGKRGITVTGVGRGRAPGDAATVAQVLGAPVQDVVEHMLDKSDNTVAEVLARLVAVRGDQPPTFDGAGRAVIDAVAALGVPTAGARFTGGSGLGRGGVIAPRTLTATIVLAASEKHPELRATLTGLPVAGVTGTLAERYSGAGQGGAVGVVRAKTGTLTGASSLAGTVVDADGRLLAFAVVADRVTSTGDARDAIDSVAAALAGCGCS
ncbi:MAG: D-alanyl-D-alanine carboxypeptidase/D-alanyl-D-alanine-endopeptidase [Actinobacteria bacterium]|nr:D-alanyl-D-alanine carboxypeptidase/D-alanyl-D-alanine-endopeptidase [Actinomycetota bacterium]